MHVTVKTDKKIAKAANGGGGGLGKLLLIAGIGALGYYLRKPENRQMAMQKMDELGVKDAATRLADTASSSWQRVTEAAGQGGLMGGGQDQNAEGSQGNAKAGVSNDQAELKSALKDAMSDAHGGTTGTTMAGTDMTGQTRSAQTSAMSSRSQAGSTDGDALQDLKEALKDARQDQQK